MKYTIALSSLALATLVSAQTPDGCSADFSGTFEYNPVPISSGLPAVAQNALCTAQPYTTLKGGVLIDQCKRTGSIVANNQFQYDLNVQNNAVNTGGFSVCSNNTLAVAGSAVFYHCLSGSFYNLYDASIGAQCSPVFLQVIPCTLPSDAGSDCPAGTPDTPPARSSSSSSTASTPSTLATFSSTSSPTAAAVTSAPVASSSVPTPVAAAVNMVVSIPYSYPTSNGTTTVATATGTGVVPPGSTGTAATSPIAFHGSASSLAMGGKLLVSAVGIAALVFLA